MKKKEKKKKKKKRKKKKKKRRKKNKTKKKKKKKGGGGEGKKELSGYGHSHLCDTASSSRNPSTSRACFSPCSIEHVVSLSS